MSSSIYYGTRAIGAPVSELMLEISSSNSPDKLHSNNQILAHSGLEIWWDQANTRHRQVYPMLSLPEVNADLFSPLYALFALCPPAVRTQSDRMIVNVLLIVILGSMTPILS